jgi:acyl-CoA dehydrogenase
VALDSQTLRQFLDTIERFVRERLEPAEESVAESDSVPPALIGEMRQLGLFGMTIPEAYGGLGLSMSEEVEVLFQLCRTSPAFRSVHGTNNGIGSQGIVLDGTEEQKRKYLPRLASGEIIASFALTEPDAGSDAASLKTSARRSGNGWVLNGTKRFITNAPEASLFTVMARTNPAEKGAAGISAFLVEAPNPGLKIGKPDRKMGQRGAHTADVVFEDCFVPADALLGGKEGQGFKTAMKVLDRGRLHIAAVAVGVAERLVRDMLRYAKERVQSAIPSASSSSCRRCSPTAAPRPMRRAPWCSMRRGAAMPARPSRPRRRAASISRPRWSAASPTAPCRSMAAPATSPITASSASTAMCGSSASMRGRARSSSSSSRATCSGMAGDPHPPTAAR